MDFTEQQQKRIEYFRRSVRLDDATTINDPAYQFTDEDLWGILEVSAPIHVGATIDETPDKDFYFVLLLAKKEIYYRLATTTAPFYPLSAEGASLEKNVRFDHYLKLVQTVMAEYADLYDRAYGGGSVEEDITGTGGVLTTYQAKLYGKSYLQRYNNLSDDIPITLEASNITQDSVNLDWTRFEATMGVDFLKYEIFVYEDLIYDEYSPTSHKITVKPLFIITDIRKTKIRVTDLEPNKEYYILAKVSSLLNISGISQIKIKTLPVPVIGEELILGGEY